jgi:hypothetical protein
MDKKIKNKYLQGISGLLVGLLVAGCSDSDEHKNRSTSAPRQSVIPQAESIENQIVKLPNVAQKEDMCAGWRRSLAKGRNQDEVAYCLRMKAWKDRVGAVQEAVAMSKWDIKETDNSDLRQLVFTLANYPEAGSLVKRLRALSLLPNEPDEYNNLNKALTAADYLKEMGNIYWFDTETGMFPNDHHLLLGAIAEKSDLIDANFTEVPPSSYESDSEPYKLTASIN